MPEPSVRVGFDVGGRLPEARKRYSVETTRTFRCGTGKFGVRYGAATVYLAPGPRPIEVRPRAWLPPVGHLHDDCRALPGSAAYSERCAHAVGALSHSDQTEVSVGRVVLRRYRETLPVVGH
jgi:hypothetical protein